MIKITGWHDNCCPCEDSQRKHFEFDYWPLVVEQIAKYLKTCLKHRSSQAKYELKERRQMALEWEANWMKEKRETTFWLEISSINKEGKGNANMVPVPKLCKSQSVGMSVILELDEEGWFRIHLNPSWLANWDRGRCWHANKRGLASASEQDAFQPKADGRTFELPQSICPPLLILIQLKPHWNELKLTK